jgi:hypothetical protein
MAAWCGISIAFLLASSRGLCIVRIFGSCGFSHSVCSSRSNVSVWIVATSHRVRVRRKVDAARYVGFAVEV